MGHPDFFREGEDALATFLTNCFQQRTIFLAKGRVFKQIRPVVQGLSQLLLAAPAANLLVVAVEQHVGRAEAGKLGRPGVVRVVEQASRAVLGAGNAV